MHTKTDKSILQAIFLNTAFFIIEIVCGFAFNSKIILADAVHDFGDVLTLLVSLRLSKIGEGKPSRKFSYGLRGINVLGAILNSAILFFACWQILRESLFDLSLNHSHNAVNAPGVLWVSLVGIAINYVAFRRTNKEKGILNKTVALHMLEDFLGWILTLISGILILVTGFQKIDQIMSIILVFVIFAGILRNLWKIVKIIMVSTPDEKTLEEIKKNISELKEVKSVDNVHFWTIDGDKNIFTARVGVHDISKHKKIRQKIDSILENKDIIDSTIEFFK